ncbi:hypothetical protein ACFLTP_01290 [Chloroflexota bacterium]
MKFADLAWAAFLYYYKSCGDRKYVKLFRDTSFINQLRQSPEDIKYVEFEEKVISGFISSIGLRLPPTRKRTNILSEIIELKPLVTNIQNINLHDCDFSNEDLLANIRGIYDRLHGMHGFWITGISKITHILNDSLFVALNLGTLSHFGLIGDTDSFIAWLKIAQENGHEATSNFFELGLEGSPESYLSEKLGYTNYGCEKSLARFIDEYYWLTTSENLPIPPRWVPQF